MLKADWSNCGWENMKTRAQTAGNASAAESQYGRHCVRVDVDNIHKEAGRLVEEVEAGFRSLDSTSGADIRDI